MIEIKNLHKSQCKKLKQVALPKMYYGRMQSNNANNFVFLIVMEN